MKETKENVLLVVTLAIFCLILYYNSFGGIFIFDDAHSIVDNLFIKSPRYIPLFFKGHYTSEADIPQGMFRPLLLLTYSFNYFFSRLQPLGYHIINTLFHFLNAIMLFCFLKLLRGWDASCILILNKPKCVSSQSPEALPFGLTLLITLLFLAHPLNSEAVCYLSSRSDLMVSFFILLGFICYFHRYFFLAFLTYIGGLLTKETALVFPLLLFALHLIFYRNTTPISKETRQRIIFFYIALAGISMLYWLYRGMLFSPMAKEAGVAPIINPPRGIWPNILTQSAVTFFYLRLFLWPQPLTIHHNFPILHSLADPRAFLSISAIIFLIILGFVLRKNRPLLVFGLAWYLICLIPKFYAPLHIVAAEHHFYLPGFGIYLILAVLFHNIYLKYRRIVIIMAMGVLAIFTILVWVRNYEYKDELTFWRKTVTDDPSSPIAHHNLGMVYTSMGLYPEAEDEFKKSALCAPAYANRVFKNIRENLANVYRLQKRFEEALREINKNMESGLYDFGTYQSLGVIYLDMKEETKALEAWVKGLGLNPKAPGILYNLGLLYLKKKELPKAKRYFQEAIKAAPDLYPLYFGLGCVLEEEGHNNDAITAHEESVRLQSNFVDAHYHLGRLYAKKSALHEALREFEETIRLAPNFAQAHNDLAVLYASIEPPQLESARTHAQKALALGYPVNENFLKIIDLEKGEKGDRLLLEK